MTGLASRFLLEAEDYTDPTVLEQEQRCLFPRTWLWLGDARDLQPGMVRAVDLLGVPVLLTRAADGVLRAFRNCCPHRAARFCTEGVHRPRHLVCPYHAWTYDLQGQLIGLPQPGSMPSDFRPADWPLLPLRLDCWQDFLFLNLGGSAPPLETVLAPIPEHLGRFRTAEAGLLFSLDYRVACNWKVYHDNTLCDYHVAPAHRTTLHRLQGPVHRYEHQLGEWVNLLATPLVRAWRDRHDPRADLPGMARERFLTYGLFPNLHLLTFPDGILVWLAIWPDGVGHCRVDVQAYGEPRTDAEVTELRQSFEAFIAEDRAIAESVQRGYAGGGYVPGPVSVLEQRIIHQQQLYRQLMKS